MNFDRLISKFKTSSKKSTSSGLLKPTISQDAHNQFLDYSKFDIDLSAVDSGSSKMSNIITNNSPYNNNNNNNNNNHNCNNCNNALYQSNNGNLNDHLTFINNEYFTVDFVLIDKLILVSDDEKRKDKDRSKDDLNDDIDAPTSKTVPVRGYLSLRFKRQVHDMNINVQLLGFIKKVNNLEPNLDKLEHLNIKDNALNVFKKDTINFHNSRPNLNQVYNLPFQFLLDYSKLPQSLTYNLCSIIYQIQVIISCEKESGNTKVNNLLKFNLFNEFKLIHCINPSLNSIPNDITAYGNWRNLLYYQFIINSKNLIINQSFNCSIKILPILSQNFNIYSIKVTLIQVISLNNKNIVITEKIPLKHKILKNSLNNTNHTALSLNFDCHLLKDFNILSKNFKLYPSISSNDDINISHKLKLGVLLREVKSSDGKKSRSRSETIDSILYEYINNSNNNIEDNADDDDEFLGESTREFTRSEDIVSNSTNSTIDDNDRKNSSNDQIVNSWIIENSKLLNERTRSVNKKIELAVCSNITLYDDLSILGNDPPPSFSNCNEVHHEEEDAAPPYSLSEINESRSSSTSTFTSIEDSPNLNSVVSNSSDSIANMTNLSIISSYDQIDYEYTKINNDLNDTNELNLPPYEII